MNYRKTLRVSRIVIKLERSTTKGIRSVGIVKIGKKQNLMASKFGNPTLAQRTRKGGATFIVVISGEIEGPLGTF
jgi:hypothetical protein